MIVVSSFYEKKVKSNNERNPLYYLLFYINITATERLRKEGSTSDPYDLNEWGYTCTAMVITEIRKVVRLIKSLKIIKVRIMG